MSDALTAYTKCYSNPWDPNHDSFLAGVSTGQSTFQTVKWGELAVQVGKNINRFRKQQWSPQHDYGCNCAVAFVKV